ncbi:hypothetical protein [Methylobacterium oxalidis]|uniref:hypothetical protein n=1 Tax=Methylobacterium oxalidis TaxID=944322 RepID=UPI00331522B8
MRLLALPVVALLAAGPGYAACDCGPDFCADDPRIAGSLAAKKQRMSQEYPARLVSLLDRGTQCVARIERSPDIFTLVLVAPEGNRTLPWSGGDENRAQAKLNSGELSRYWIVHGRRAFSCCGEPRHDEMSDYDATDDVNASRAIRCVRGVPC